MCVCGLQRILAQELGKSAATQQDDDSGMARPCTNDDGLGIVKGLCDTDYRLRAFVFEAPDGNRIDVGQPINRPRCGRSDAILACGP